jgi:hypothetical protein
MSQLSQSQQVNSFIDWHFYKAYIRFSFPYYTGGTSFAMGTSGSITCTSVYGFSTTTPACTMAYFPVANPTEIYVTVSSPNPTSTYYTVNVNSNNS